MHLQVLATLLRTVMAEETFFPSLDMPSRSSRLAAMCTASRQCNYGLLTLGTAKLDTYLLSTAICEAPKSWFRSRGRLRYFGLVCQGCQPLQEDPRLTLYVVSTPASALLKLHSLPSAESNKLVRHIASPLSVPSVVIVLL